MASSYTDLGIEKMATGENAGTWGTKTNTNLDIIEKSIAGYVEQAVTSGGTTALSITDGDATESTSVARHAVIKLTGTITGNSIVTVPDSVEKVYIVTNGTSGAYTVQFKTASGTGITFGTTEKTTRLVYSDGTNLVDSGFSGASDMEGRELILDADGDTSLTADTDDQIDIKIAGADDFQFTANTFTAQSGSTIAAQALTATTITTTGAIAIPNDGNIGSAGDADAIAISSSGVVTFSQSPVFPDGSIAGADIDIDGTTDIGAAIVDADEFLIDDGGGGTNRRTDASRIKTYIADVTLTTAAQTNITSLGTLSALTVDDVAIDGKVMTMTGSSSDTAVFTAGTNGTLSIVTTDDSAAAANITITADGTFEADGTTVTLDSAGDIRLDSDDGQIIFRDNGSDWGLIKHSSNDIIFENKTSDKDIIFRGEDSSSTVNALTLDFSDAGAAIFAGTVTANAGLKADNITIDGTEIDLSSGDLTIDSAGDITLDADGADVNVADGGTTFGQFTNSSSDFVINAPVQDKDIIFKGDDGGSAITALTLDMSAAGAATFNSTITANNQDVILGKSGGTNFARSFLIGHSTTGTLSSAEDNLGIGDAALDSVTSGDQNICLGSNAGTAITTASANVYIGRNSGSGNATGSSNFGLGVDCLEDGSFTGASNVAIGRSAGAQVESGNYNILIGQSAGDNITTGHGNLIIGATVDAASATGSRQLKIAGYDGSTTTTWISGDSDGVVTLADDLVIKDGGTIGVSSDADAISIASNGVVTFSQTPVNSAGTAFSTEDPTALAIALG